MYNIYFRERTFTILEEGTDHGFLNSSMICRIGNNYSDAAKVFAEFDCSINTDRLVVLTDSEDKAFNEICNRYRIINAGGGLVKDRDGRFLTILRNRIWDLPKGKQENGENIMETSVREVEEECGITDLRIDHFICATYHTYRINGELVIKNTCWYAMNCDSDMVPEPQKEEGIEKAVWSEKKELLDRVKESYPSIREVVSTELGS